MKSLKIHPLAVFWIGILTLWISLTRSPAMDLNHLLEFPRFLGGPTGIFGTDAFGRDLFATLGEAMRRSLLFALLATIAATFFGVFVGAAIGMTEGRVRFWSERVLDFFLAFPPMLLALGVQAAIGTGWRALGFSVSIGLFPVVVRFISVRAKEISLTDYVTAARAMGASRISIFWLHYRPGLIDHLRLKLPSLFAQALLLEATLSFLNLGVQPGVLSWGSLLTQAKDYLIEAPYIAWFTGLPLVFTLLSLQNLADHKAPN